MRKPTGSEDQLRTDILSLVADAPGGAIDAGPLGKLRVVIRGDQGGDLHDPKEVLEQVAELVLGGLEVTSTEGKAKRVMFKGSQLVRAFSDNHLLEVMKVEVSYVILTALGDFIFARTEVGQASEDVRKAIESLTLIIEQHLASNIRTLGGRTQQLLMSIVREALSESTEERLALTEQKDRQNKQDLIRELTRKVIDAFTEGMKEFMADRERFQRMAEQGFENAASLPQFNQVLDRNLCAIFDHVWGKGFERSIEACLSDCEARRMLSGFDVMQTLDYTKTQVLPAARSAFVGILMGTHRVRTPFGQRGRVA